MLTVLEQWRQFLPAHPWIGHALEIAALVLGAWLSRALVIGQLRRFTRRTRTTLDDALVDILDRAIKPTLVFAIIVASLNLLPLVTQIFKQPRPKRSPKLRGGATLVS